MEQPPLCRLCALAKEELLGIFEDEGSKLLIASKVKKLLNIELLIESNLPKSICVDCCNKVEAFNEFLEVTLNAQLTLSILYSNPNLKEKETSCDEALSSESNCDADKLYQPVTAPANTDNFDKSPDSSQNGEFNQLPLTDEFLRKEGMNGMCDKDAYFESTPAASNSVEEKSSNDNNKVAAEEKPKEPEKNNEWDCDAWLCSDCSEVLPTVEQLTQHHINEHQQEVRYMCSVCSKIILVFNEFLAHMKCHSIPSCEFCGKDFYDKKTLERHRGSHSTVRPFVCVECGKGFRQQSSLLAHSKSHLPDHARRKFPCTLCQKKFSSKQNLVTHMRIHSGVRDFTCDQCGKGFIQKGNLDAHLLTHSIDKPFPCESCDKSFKTSMQLKKHMRVHSGTKPHQCDVCGRLFREKGTLKEHHRIHTGALPFTCEYCGKSFRFKGVLTTHRRQHTGERPYSCIQCQHHFTNWPNYNKHMKRRHGVNTSRAARRRTGPEPDLTTALVMYSEQLDHDLLLGTEFPQPAQPEPPTPVFVYSLEAPTLDIIQR